MCLLNQRKNKPEKKISLGNNFQIEEVKEAIKS